MEQSNVIRIGKNRSLSEDLPAAIDGFINYCKCKNLSPNTLIYYRSRLDAFHTYVEMSCPGTTPEGVSAQLVREFLADQNQRRSDTTACHSYVALNTFFSFLVNDGFLDVSPMARVDKPKRRRVVVDTFSLEQVESVLATCKRDFVGVRDRAVIVLMLDCGLRVSELCGLRLEDIDWTGQTMLVLGKGDVERIVPFGHAGRQALNDYLTRRRSLDTTALFVNVYGNPCNRFTIRSMLQARCERAGISVVRCSPHTLRHTFAVHYLRNGGDVFSLQKLLGHSDLTMTRRYAELSQTDVQDKHRMFSPADRLKQPEAMTGRKRLR